MSRQPFRIEPNAGPEFFRTFQIVSPIATHWRPATCKEVGCRKWEGGFRSSIDVSTDIGQRQAAYIETQSGRHFLRTQTGSIMVYDFHPGQPCFTEHRVPLERPPLYVIRDGDHRGNPRGTTPQTRTPDEWVDQFGAHQQRIADAHEKG